MRTGSRVRDQCLRSEGAVASLEFPDGATYRDFTLVLGQQQTQAAQGRHP